MNKKHRFGIYAEYLVILIYRLKFYSILAHRMRNFVSEIDIICQRGNQIVFVEVKARSGNIDDVLCTSFQKKKISKAAEVFLQKNPKYSKCDLRFDFALVKPYRLPHIIENAW